MTATDLLGPTRKAVYVDLANARAVIQRAIEQFVAGGSIDADLTEAYRCVLSAQIKLALIKED